MRRDAMDDAIQGALNSPRKAVVLLMVLGAFGAGYYLGGHGLPAGMVPPNGSVGGAAQDNISVHFSPKGGSTDAIVAEIREAKQSIHVQAYSFTSRGIIAALVDAHRRGVKVILVNDKKAADEPGSKVAEAAEAGIDVRVDGRHPIAHNKIMLIDGRTIITGSFNFTNQAENSNAENLLVLHDKPELYKGYEASFQQHLAHADAYTAGEAKSERRTR